MNVESEFINSLYKGLCKLIKGWFFKRIKRAPRNYFNNMSFSSFGYYLNHFIRGD